LPDVVVPHPSSRTDTVGRPSTADSSTSAPAAPACLTTLVNASQTTK